MTVQRPRAFAGCRSRSMTLPAVSSQLVKKPFCHEDLGDCTGHHRDDRQGRQPCQQPQHQAEAAQELEETGRIRDRQRQPDRKK